LPESGEELRGIFVLGLIAAIATVRYAIGNSFTIPVGSRSVDIVPILNLILVTWSAYAFLVVLALSTSRWSTVFLGYARIFLYMGLILTLVVLYFSFLGGYAPTSYYVSLLFVAYASLALPKYLISIFKKPKRVNVMKIDMESVAGMVFGISLVLLVALGLTNLLPLIYAQVTTVVGLVGVLVTALVRFRRFISGRHQKRVSP